MVICIHAKLLGGSCRVLRWILVDKLKMDRVFSNGLLRPVLVPAVLFVFFPAVSYIRVEVLSGPPAWYEHDLRGYVRATRSAADPPPIPKEWLKPRFRNNDRSLAAGMELVSLERFGLVECSGDILPILADVQFGSSLQLFQILVGYITGVW